MSGQLTRTFFFFTRGWHKIIYNSGDELHGTSKVIMEDRNISEQSTKRVDPSEEHQAKVSRPASRGSTGRNEQAPSRKSLQQEDVDRHERDHAADSMEDVGVDKNLYSSGGSDELEGRTRGFASESETDEDENEGLGDGNIGRSVKSPGFDEEG